MQSHICKSRWLLTIYPGSSKDSRWVFPSLNCTLLLLNFVNGCSCCSFQLVCLYTLLILIGINDAFWYLRVLEHFYEEIVTKPLEILRKESLILALFPWVCCLSFIYIEVESFIYLEGSPKEWDRILVSSIGEILFCFLLFFF